nr:hypothetical protein [Tanacetum cinerariifolium]
MEEGPSQDYILMPLWNGGPLFDSSPKDLDGENPDTDGSSTESKIDNQERPNDENSTKDINTIGPSINTASSNINTASLTINTVWLSDDYFGASNDMRRLDGVELDITNLSTTYPVPTTLNTRINKDYSLDNKIGDMQSGVQTRRMTVTTDDQGFIRKRASFNAGQSSMEEGPSQDYILMPLWNGGPLFDSSPKDSDGENPDTDGSSTESKIDNQERPNDENNTKDINTIGPSINTASSNINTASLTN